MLYQHTGDYTKAIPLYQRALAIREKTLGPEHPHTAMSLNNLAGLYFRLGDFARAEPLYQRALAIKEKILGPEHPDTAASLNNLAMLYQDTGDFAKAEPLYQRALAIYEKALGPEHPDAAGSLNNLAGLYFRLGDFARAEPVFQRALAIREKVLGPEHPHTAASLGYLAGLYASMGDYAKAEPLYQRALAIHEKTLGPEHPDTAASLNNLAMLYQDTGDYAKAEPLYQRALAIKEKILGPENPDTAISLNNLAVLTSAKGDYASAHELRLKAQMISAQLIDQVMGFTSEDQKVKFLATQQGELEASISLVAFYLTENRKAVREILDVWLGRKGVILEVQRRFQEALVYMDHPEAAEVFQKLASVRSQLARLMFGGPGREEPDAYRKKIAELEAREQKLETRLSKLSQLFARQKKVKRANAASVAKSLPPNSVLVDFAQIHPFDFQAKGRERKWGPARYLAFVLPAGEPEKVALLDLGETKLIDQSVSVLKAAVDDETDKTGKKAAAAGEKLYDLVFAKLEKNSAEQSRYSYPRTAISTSSLSRCCGGRMGNTSSRNTCSTTWHPGGT